MKTILIATDFSNASRNASLYGVELAKALKAKIILFNAYEVPKPAPGLGVSVSRYDVMTQTDKRLQDEANLLDCNPGIIEIICDEGNSEDAITNVANEKKVDFIIAGMKGRGKNLKKIFGSTATSLIRRSDIPVIIVPEAAKFSVPKIILYASDIISDTNIELVDQIKPITGTFESKLFVVRVIKDQYTEIIERLNTPGKLREELKKSNASFEYPVDTDVGHALNEFIRKQHVNLLVMMPHKHEWWERLFRKSETKDMIIHSHIPILVIPETH
jgi:nucleotide-binding universal stress UspA family protein